MHGPLNLLVSYNGCFNDVVSMIEQFIGKKLIVNCDEMGFKCSFELLDIEFVLFNNHGFEDDLGIPFSKYNFVLDMLQLTTGQNVENYQTFFISAAKYIAARISTTFSCEVLVVENLQKVIAAFP